MTENLKLFTLEKANELIPVLTPMVQDLQDLRVQIDKLEVEIDALELIAKGTSHESQTSQDLNEKVSVLNTTIREMNLALKNVETLGCSPKSIEIGLVDFLSEYQGRHVYLCWRIGEIEVTHWHEMDEGFTNRKPVDGEM
jgi:hypothetical protein